MAAAAAPATAAAHQCRLAAFRQQQQQRLLARPSASALRRRQLVAAPATSASLARCGSGAAPKRPSKRRLIYATPRPLASQGLSASECLRSQAATSCTITCSCHIGERGDTDGLVERELEGTEPGDDTRRKDGLAVHVALALLRFYKNEISPFIPGSCRYVPTCSVYAMEAFAKYGLAKGAVLTACRLARCNPLGGSGFDPPRWFGEPKPPAF